MTTITVSIEQRFRDVSDWLTRLTNEFETAKHTYWQFIFDLRDGIDQFGRTDHGKMHLYELAAGQLGLSVKTVQNYVSAARSPLSATACDLGLEVWHLMAVLGLDIEVGHDLLSTAAEQGLTPSRTGQLAWVHKNPIPNTGNTQNGAHPTIEIAQPVMHQNGYDDAPPFANEPYYQESDRADTIARLVCPHCGKEFAA